MWTQLERILESLKHSLKHHESPPENSRTKHVNLRSLSEISRPILSTCALASLDCCDQTPWTWEARVGGVFSTGGWLTHGEFALEPHLDFVAVAEHRVIFSRARNEWSWLRQRRIHSVWGPADQNSSHVGAAGVGIVRLRGASVTLVTFAAAEFETLYDQG